MLSNELNKNDKRSDGNESLESGGNILDNPNNKIKIFIPIVVTKAYINTPIYKEPNKSLFVENKPVDLEKIINLLVPKDLPQSASRPFYSTLEKANDFILSSSIDFIVSSSLDPSDCWCIVEIRITLKTLETILVPNSEIRSDNRGYFYMEKYPINKNDIISLYLSTNNSDIFGNKYNIELLTVIKNDSLLALFNDRLSNLSNVNKTIKTSILHDLQCNITYRALSDIYSLFNKAIIIDKNILRSKLGVSLSSFGDTDSYKKAITIIVRQAEKIERFSFEDCQQFYEIWREAKRLDISSIVFDLKQSKEKALALFNTEINKITNLNGLDNIYKRLQDPKNILKHEQNFITVKNGNTTSYKQAIVAITNKILLLPAGESDKPFLQAIQQEFKESLWKSKLFTTELYDKLTDKINNIGNVEENSDLLLSHHTL